ncbi:MAG: DUF3450 domain-containing protein [Desulfobacteraceae bacterium]
MIPYQIKTRGRNQIQKKGKRLIAAAAWVCFLASAGTGVADTTKKSSEHVAQQAQQSVETAIDLRQETQKTRDRWTREKEKLIRKYNSLKQENTQLKSMNDELSKQLAAKTGSIEKIKFQITEIEKISSNIQPFLETCVDDLRNMVTQGLPLLIKEREIRVAALEKTLADPGISSSEKFRKTMEALFIEAEYGNTIEVYQKNILFDKEKVLADIFRLGRISLFCRTPDGKKTGTYDRAEGEWQVLDSRFNSEINRAFAMGRKREPIDFLNLPLGRMAVQ